MNKMNDYFKCHVTDDIYMVTREVYQRHIYLLNPKTGKWRHCHDGRYWFVPELYITIFPISLEEIL